MLPYRDDHAGPAPLLVRLPHCTAFWVRPEQVLSVSEDSDGDLVLRLRDHPDNIRPRGTYPEGAIDEIARFICDAVSRR